MTLRNDLDAAFDRAREEKRGVLLPYLTAGFPDRSSFVDLALAILDAGADALEIGVPFSDPLLDGVSIQGSQQRALEEGITPVDCLQLAAEIQGRCEKPLLFMGAYNPIYAYGVERFSQDAAESGLSALIVPDVPFEEQGELQAGSAAHSLHLIQLVAPTSTDARLERICAQASGFIYCISVTGVTGARASLAETAQPLVERVRRCSGLPLVVGFGIAGPDQARAVIQFADGIAIGGRLIDLIRETPATEREHAVRDFIGSLCQALSDTWQCIS